MQHCFLFGDLHDFKPLFYYDLQIRYTTSKKKLISSFVLNQARNARLLHPNYISSSCDFIIGKCRKATTFS